MLVFAYCAESLRSVVERAAGVQPVTCPPVTLDSFKPEWLERKSLLYFNLDGAPDEPYWYGDGWETALSVGKVNQADLGGAIVFVANCYLPESPFLATLLKAGASFVVGGSGTNYARKSRVGGADLLGMWFRRCLMRGFSPERALKIAKWRVRLTRDKAARDAAEFMSWRNDDGM
jgi:hypothetical protein